MNDIPEHRAATAVRSGDTHVIGKDGKAVNVDQEARDRVAAEARKAAPPVAPRDPLDHDGDGRKGGMLGVAAKTAAPPKAD